jgi:hypothetical protein
MHSSVCRAKVGARASPSPPPHAIRERAVCAMTRVSFETSFDSKQPKLEPKLVSALSETKRLFRLFRYYTETASFGVSIEPKQTEDQPKPRAEIETNYEICYHLCAFQL